MLLTNNKWPTIYLATHFSNLRSNKHKNQSWVPVSSTYKLSYCQIRNPVRTPPTPKTDLTNWVSVKKKKKTTKTKHDFINTFEVHENTVLSAPRFALANNDSRKNLLTQIRLAFLDSGHDHVTNASWRQAIEPTFDPFDGYDVEILSTSVVCAVHSCCHGKTQWHPELVPSRSSPTCIDFSYGF